MGVLPRLRAPQVARVRVHRLPLGPRRRDLDRRPGAGAAAAAVPGRVPGDLGEEFLCVAPDLHGRLGAYVLLNSAPGAAMELHGFQEELVLLLGPFLPLLGYHVRLSRLGEAGLGHHPRIAAGIQQIWLGFLKTSHVSL